MKAILSEQDFRAMFPRASADTIAANTNENHPYNSTPGSELESPIRNESVAASAGKAENPKRHVVSITSYRARLLDPDNLCPKYFIDFLRYCGAIPDDREEDIILEIKQEKVAHRAQEKTVIQITLVDAPCGVQ
jgi:hypothetical protein